MCADPPLRLRSVRQPRSSYSALSTSRTYVKSQPSLHLPGKKWIVLFFFSNRRHRSVTRTNDGLIGQRQDFLEIIPQRIIVGNVSTTHRAGKKRIAYDCDRTRATVHNISHSARGVAPG